MALKPNVAINQSYQSGSSTNSAQSYSKTFGTQATAAAANAASVANNSASAAWKEAAQYNAEQARIQREWQERMANTVYQRSVADMKAAGINPILAAQMGLGTASVGSGATASMTAPDVFMGRTFADQQSASTASGNSWSESEAGLATFLEHMGTMIDAMVQNLTSSKTIEIAFKGIKNALENGNKEDAEKFSNGTYRTLGKGYVPDYGSLAYGFQKYLKAHNLL